MTVYRRAAGWLPEDRCWTGRGKRLSLHPLTPWHMPATLTHASFTICCWLPASERARNKRGERKRNKTAQPVNQLELSSTSLPRSDQRTQPDMEFAFRPGTWEVASRKGEGLNGKTVIQAGTATICWMLQQCCKGHMRFQPAFSVPKGHVHFHSTGQLCSQTLISARGSVREKIDKAHPGGEGNETQHHLLGVFLIKGYLHYHSKQQQPFIFSPSL